MIKRIISVIFILILTIAVFIPIVNAESEFIVSPDNDEQPLYTILGSTIYPEPKSYTIYGYNAKSITKPSYLVPLIRTFFGDPSEMTSGTYEYDLYSTSSSIHRSYLQLNIYQGVTYTLKYCVENLQTDISASWFICSQIPVSADICFYAENDGVIKIVPYDTLTFEVLSIDNYTNTDLKVYFYGDIYLYGQTPSSQDAQEAYNTGYQAGEEKGYADGYRDGTLTEAEIQAIFDRGKAEGYTEGKNDGIIEGASMDNEAVLTTGINIGQNQAQLIPEAINGFWNAMTGFFTPFLSIGIGNLNLYNLLAVLIVIVIVVIILKVTRK